jgi:hypothetical protein
MVAKPPHKLLDGRVHAFEVTADGAPKVVELNIPFEAKR